MKKFKLSDVQTEAILNMRLRSLRKLEELEIKKEHKSLKAEQKQLKALLRSQEAQWKQITEELRNVRKKFDPTSDLGRRRTLIAAPPQVEDSNFETLKYLWTKNH